MGEDTIWASSAVGLVPVNRQKVEWVEAQKDYVLLHLAHRAFIVRATMGRAEAMFRPGEMLRVHRSALVRLTAIAAVRRPGQGRMVIQLRSGAEVPVSRSQRTQVLDALRLRARALPR